jgi:D-sedoheptulose 7-phosphate isomerase
MNRIEQLYAEDPSPATFARGYLDYLAEILGQLDADEIAGFVAELLRARDSGGRIYFCGNGGSAATASHFVNDIAIGSRSWLRPFRAVCLSDNTAVLTSIANDFGYERIFVQQLQGHLQPDDLVVAISVSGNSPNVLAAVEYARACGVRVVGLTGFDGGRLRELADVAVHVPTGAGEYGPAEDAHMILDHLVGAYLARVCAEA